MSEEEKNENKCFCQSKSFRKFLVIALGTFVGVYAALSLFAALHRPPCPFAGGYGYPAPIAAPMPYKHHHFDKAFKGEKGDFNKAIKGPNAPKPFEREHDD